jgi:hypothetical protein
MALRAITKRWHSLAQAAAVRRTSTIARHPRARLVSARGRGAAVMPRFIVGGTPRIMQDSLIARVTAALAEPDADYALNEALTVLATAGIGPRTRPDGTPWLEIQHGGRRISLDVIGERHSPISWCST